MPSIRISPGYFTRINPWLGIIDDFYKLFIIVIFMFVQFISCKGGQFGRDQMLAQGFKNIKKPPKSQNLVRIQRIFSS